MCAYKKGTLNNPSLPYNIIYSDMKPKPTGLADEMHGTVNYSVSTKQTFRQKELAYTSHVICLLILVLYRYGFLPIIQCADTD